MCSNLRGRRHRSWSRRWSRHHPGQPAMELLSMMRTPWSRHQRMMLQAVPMLPKLERPIRPGSIQGLSKWLTLHQQMRNGRSLRIGNDPLPGPIQLLKRLVAKGANTTGPSQTLGGPTVVGTSGRRDPTNGTRRNGGKMEDGQQMLQEVLLPNRGSMDMQMKVPLPIHGSMIMQMKVPLPNRGPMDEQMKMPLPNRGTTDLRMRAPCTLQLVLLQKFHMYKKRLAVEVPLQKCDMYKKRPAVEVKLLLLRWKWRRDRLRTNRQQQSPAAGREPSNHQAAWVPPSLLRSTCLRQAHKAAMRMMRTALTWGKTGCLTR
mmetsp:Transcript_37305/g.71788  ORF Transcript_37305/g.71788 Transcript_37305/m.71788 type:complete len:316 (+) Transcript_37305:142-1089(+)